MQFPYPRKASSPASPYTTSRSTFPHRRRTLALYAVAAVAALSLLFHLLGSLLTPRNASSASSTRIPPGTPGAVIVTTLDPSLSPLHRANIIANRKDYAHRHGYTAFFPNTTDYDLMPHIPASWSTVPALRHVMTLHPHTPWLWYLSSTALIMNPALALPTHITAPQRLENLMIPNRPVVPPDSVIRTFSHLRGERVDFILTQDKDGLAGGSLLVRTGEWAKFFLDAWFDPLYRSYNFQKAEGHALEHIVQWHGTILAKLALVPQRTMNSYTREAGGASAGEDGLYHEGDFTANFHGCQRDGARDCEQEMAPLMTRWKELRDQERRR
ncbi:putative alpha-1,6-mannosyltransferase mnn11 [Teratosphaeriaceae sp. CCFEE 6253]|nr:putative alpha-1,6-mannosyltransferase mnn11 [Teratosphaeriaceae sp. CCFEE 6253]